MKWFKHENTFNNAKIEMLSEEHGIVGYGVYFRLLELIALSIDESNPEDWGYLPEIYTTQYLAKKLQVEEGELKKIMDTCIRLELFEMREKKLYCQKILERCDDYTQRLLKQYMDKVGTLSEEKPTKNRIDKKRIEKNNIIPTDKQPETVNVHTRISLEKATVVQRICYHLEDELSTKIVNWGKQGDAIKAMLKAGYTEDQIKKTITYMAKKDEFFIDKGFDMTTVANQIGRYKARASRGKEQSATHEVSNG